MLQKVVQPMVARNEGKVLITGSIAGFMPGSFKTVASPRRTLTMA